MRGRAGRLPVPEPIYSLAVDKILSEIESDPTRVELWNAICDAIDLVCDHPGSREARRGVLRDLDGQPVWVVPVRTRTEDWVLLWRPEGDLIAIAYLGPADFRP